MIHGAGGSIEVWFRQVADYARHFNLLLVDLAGHGGSSSEAFGKGFNFSRAAEQVMEVVNHLKIEKGQLRTLFQICGFRLAVEDALQCPVDLVTSESSDPAFLEMIKKDEVLLYGTAG